MKTLIFSLLTLIAVPFSTLAAPSTIPDFAKFGVHAKVTKVTHKRLDQLSEAEDRYFLKVKLGRLEQKQFQDLMAHYGNKSQVPFDPNRDYDLIDFLPPAIQATVNKVFEPKDYDTTSLFDVDFEGLDEESGMIFWALRKNGVSHSTNCWNTSTQVLKSIRSELPFKYELYWPDRWNMDSEIKDSSVSRIVSEGELRPFDALVISFKDAYSAGVDETGETSMLQHTALVLSESLVFEKTDSSENDPYRISFREDVLQKYSKIFEDGQRVIEYRRFNEDGQETFEEAKPNPLSSFLGDSGIKILKDLAPEILTLDISIGCETGLGGGCDQIISEVRNIEITTDPETGRGKISASPDLLKRFIPLK